MVKGDLSRSNRIEIAVFWVKNGDYKQTAKPVDLCEISEMLGLRNHKSGQ